MKQILLLIIFILTVSSLAYADVVLYLKSNVAISHNCTIGDIAVVDGNDAETVKKIVLPDFFLNDGYITKKEVYDTIKESISDLIVIHGNAVKILKSEDSLICNDISNELSPAIKELNVTKGDIVTVKLIKKSIVIEVSGKALQSGKTGDDIKISLQNGKIVTGKIASTGVECYL